MSNNDLSNDTLHISNMANSLVFSWTDYILFILMLILSVLIGIHFGIKKQDTTIKYLLGGKQMGIFPVSVSLVASHLSGITLLALPSDIYYYGTAYWACLFSGLIVSVSVIYVYLPVFHKLQLTSSFEYLQIRFDRKIRYITSFLFVLKSILYVPICLYIPALAFGQVTGINIHWVTPIICLVCIFYTTIGGLKAVIWTDTLQFVVTVSTMATVLVLGIYYAGGFGNIWMKSEEGGRIDFFNMDPRLTSRCTFWGITIGLTVIWIADFGVNQSCIQKFLSVPTYDDAKKAIYIFCLGVVVVKSISCFTGLIMYTRYQFCDPLTAGVLSRPDQLLPHYIMDVSGNIPGLPGLFIAGVFSAALSTMSAALNTMSGTLYDDFIAPFMPQGTTEKTASNIMKICTVVTGFICVALVFIVERLGGILPVAISIASVTAGPMLGLFTLGICCPWANARGAFIGGITSIATVVWIVFGAQYHKARRNIVYPKLPLYTMSCDNPDNFTLPSNFTFPTTFNKEPYIDDDVFILYQLSYMYYAVFGTIICLVVGLIVSWITGFENLEQMNPDLISPVMQFVLPKKKLKVIENKEMGEYKTIDKALDMIKS